MECLEANAKPNYFEHWKSDPLILNQFFEAVAANFKLWSGKKTFSQVSKSHALYRQSVYGNCSIDEPESLQSKEWMKWKAWSDIRGMPSDMAKRRYISFLAEIDPSLLDVAPLEEPPAGFPRIDEDNGDTVPICAKCNTIEGCKRVLYDRQKRNLKNHLFENQELHGDPKLLCDWTRNALENQRCIWGNRSAYPLCHHFLFSPHFSP